MDKLYSISKTAEILDVSPKTLRIWDKEGKLNPVLTSGGHRRYKESDINDIINGNTSDYFKARYAELYSNNEFVKQIYLNSDKFKQITIDKNGTMFVSIVEVEKSENGYFEEKEYEYFNITNILFKQQYVKSSTNKIISKRYTGNTN